MYRVKVRYPPPHVYFLDNYIHMRALNLASLVILNALALYEVHFIRLTRDIINVLVFTTKFVYHNYSTGT